MVLMYFIVNRLVLLCRYIILQGISDSMQARFDANVLDTLSSLKELAYSLVANGLNYMENIKHNEYVFLHNLQTSFMYIYTAKITDLII